MLTLAVRAHVALLLLADALASRVTRLRDERGQATAEYALVLLGAASIALLVAMWARNTNRIGRLLDAVFNQLGSLVR